MILKMLTGQTVKEFVFIYFSSPLTSISQVEVPQDQTTKHAARSLIYIYQSADVFPSMATSY